MKRRLRAFLAELRRRKVYQVAVGYAAVAVAISVSAPDLFSAFGLPTTAARFVILILALGFPLALVLAWAYEVRPEEPKQDKGGGPALVSPAPVRPPTATQAPAPHSPVVAQPSGEPRPSLAVLPFASFSEDAGVDYFGLGVMEDILMRLTRVRGIRLVSRTSVMRYRAAERSAREIAQELGVRTVLEGSIRRSEDRVRIVAQLIDGISEEHLWAETYDRELKDIFQVQTEVAESIATALAAELTEAERASVRRIPTDNLEAWDLFVRGRKTFQSLLPGDLAVAQEHLRAAVRLDPGFAQAWATLAQVLVLTAMSVNEHPSELVPKTRDAAAKALALDPRCSQAHAAQGAVKLFHDWRPQEAEAEFDRALEINPDDAFALDWKADLLTFTGRKAEALATARQAIALEPLSLIGHTTLGMVLLFTDRTDEAIDALNKALEIWLDAAHLHLWLAQAYSYVDRHEEAQVEYEVAAELTGHPPHFDAYRGAGLARMGRADEARAILGQLETRSRHEYVDPCGTFAITLAVDGWEAAVPHLERAVAVHSFLLPYVLSAPRFRLFHQDPRFRSAVERVFPGIGARH